MTQRHADAWAVWYGPGGDYQQATFDHGLAPKLATKLHGTVHPMAYVENFMLDSRSERNLQGVHPALVTVVRRAHEIVEDRDDGLGFVVTEGLRTHDRQVELVRVGASQTLASKHLTGHAVDLAATVESSVRWDWPLYKALADAMKAAAKEAGVQITWGGDWKGFPDGPHFELNPQVYTA